LDSQCERQLLEPVLKADQLPLEATQRERTGSLIVGQLPSTSTLSRDRPRH
jgi:hypothetical protein